MLYGLEMLTVTRRQEIEVEVAELKKQRLHILECLETKLEMPD